MSKISYSKYLEIIRDPNTSRQTLLDLTRVERGKGGLDFRIVANPDAVDIDDIDEVFENALGIGNGIDRFHRRNVFFQKIRKSPDTPILVSEGDSWFQFPLIIKDVIDHLGEDYAIWSLGAAGDTAENMVFGPSANEGAEYMIGLRRHRNKVQAFLFSGAGNDIIGEDPATKVPVLQYLINPFNGDTSDVLGHVNTAAVNERIATLRAAYTKVVDTVRAEPGLEDLPILFHGYDIPFAYPAGGDDRRNPYWADKDQWLGSAFAPKRIMDADLRRGILKHLLGRLYDMLDEVAGGASRVYVVDCRGVLSDLDDWADEIHGTSAGFAKIAQKFRTTLDLARA